MAVDRETKIKYISIVTDKDSAYQKGLFEYAKEQGMSGGKGVGDKDCFYADEKNHIWAIDEYYFEDSAISNGAILHISVAGENSSGKTYVNLEIPLSDAVLIDILQYSIKKFNKLKTAMESLK